MSVISTDLLSEILEEYKNKTHFIFSSACRVLSVHSPAFEDYSKAKRWQLQPLSDRIMNKESEQDEAEAS